MLPATAHFTIYFKYFKKILLHLQYFQEKSQLILFGNFGVSAFEKGLLTEAPNLKSDDFCIIVQ